MSQPTARGGALARRDFRALVLARLFVWIAGAVSAVALPVAVYQKTGEASVAAALAALEVTPYLAVGLIAGAVADRWAIRRVALACCLLCALMSATVPLVALASEVSTVQLFAIALVAGTALVFFDAAMFAALPAIVGREHLASAFSTMTTTATLVGLCGPAAGGFLVAAIGPERALAIDSVAFLLSGAVFLRMREPQRAAPDGPPRMIRDIREGLLFIAGQRTIRTLTLLGIGNSIAEGLMAGMLVATIAQVFAHGSDGSGVGLAHAAIAAGAFAGAWLSPRLATRLTIAQVVVAGLCVAAVGLTGWSQQPQFWIGIVALGVYQVGATVVILNGLTVRARLTPDRLQGRVNTTGRMVAWGGQPIGAFTASGLVGFLGVAGVQRLGVGMLLVTAAVAFVALRSLPTSAALAPGEREGRPSSAAQPADG